LPDDRSRHVASFAGSVTSLALIWHSPLQIAHTDENTRAHAPAA